MRSRRFVTLLSVLALGLAGWLPVVNFLSLFVSAELGGGVAGAGLLLAVMHGTRGTVGVLAGVLIGRLGSQRTYALGLAGLAALVGLMAVTPNLALIVIAAPFGGLALTMHWAGAQTYAMEVAPGERRGLASSLVSFAVVAAPGVGGLALGALANAYGFRVFAGVSAVLIGLAAAAAVTALPAPARTAPAPWARSVRDLAGLARRPSLQVLAFIRACTTVTYGAFVILAGPKLVAAGGDLTSVGWLIFLAAGAGAAAQVAVGALSDRAGRRGALAAVLVLGAATSALYSQADTFGALLGLWAPYAFSQSAFQSLIVALAADVAPRGRLGQVMAIDSTAYSVGVTIAAVLAMLVGATAPAALLWAGAGAALAALAALSRLRAVPAAAP